jgi:hypothetical protein
MNPKKRIARSARIRQPIPQQPQPDFLGGEGGGGVEIDIECLV